MEFIPKTTKLGAAGGIMLTIGLVIIIANIISLSQSQGFCTSPLPNPILSALYFPGLVSAMIGAIILIITSSIMWAKAG